MVRAATVRDGLTQDRPGGSADRQRGKSVRGAAFVPAPVRARRAAWKMLLSYCAMDAVSWLVVFFTACTGIGYVLWCLDRLPRVRLVLLLVAVPLFVTAITMHGNFFSAPSLPSAPMMTSQ